MTPATDVSDADAEWALSRMRGGDGVSRMVPDCFPAVVRLMHELRTGDEAPSPRWSDALPDFFQDGPNGFLHHQVEPYHVTDGTLPRDYLPRLLPLLIDTTTTPQLSWYALWKGFGGISGSGASGMLLSSNGDMTSGQIELERRRLQGDADSAAATARRFVASCAEIPWWGAREMALMSGSLSAVDALGGPTAFAEGVSALGPQMWWPADRAWFAATDIDDAWTYIAGPGSLIDAVLDLDRRRVLEAYEVSFDQRW